MFPLPFFLPLSLHASLCASCPPSSPPLQVSLPGTLIIPSRKDLTHQAAPGCWRFPLWEPLKGIWPAFHFLLPRYLFLQTMALNESSPRSIVVGIKSLFSLLPTSPAKPRNPTAPHSQRIGGGVRCDKEVYRFPWFLYKGNLGNHWRTTALSCTCWGAARLPRGEEPSFAIGPTCHLVLGYTFPRKLLPITSFPPHSSFAGHCVV